MLKPRPKLLWITLVLPAIIGWSMQDHREQKFSPMSDVVCTSSKAYAMMPPELVSAENVVSADWSNDGQYLAFIRNADPFQLDADFKPTNKDKLPAGVVCLWNAKSKSTSQLYKTPNSVMVERCYWLNGANVLFVCAKQLVPASEVKAAPPAGPPLPENPGMRYWRHAIYRFTPSDPVGKLVLQVDGDDNEPGLGLSLATKQPLAIVEYGQQHWLINGFGMKAVSVSSQPGRLFFDADGRPVYSPLSRTGERIYRVDEETGGIDNSRPIQIKMPDHAGPASSILWGELVRTQVSAGGVRKTVTVAWLTADGSADKAYIASDCREVKIPAAANGVCYISQGSLFVRRITPMPVESYRQLQKQDAMQNAKMMGLAAIMYASDYDDQIFPSITNWYEILEPYFFPRQLPDGFIWTYSGKIPPEGPQAKVTALGYYKVNGGQATVYADGHAVWKPMP